MSRDDLERIDPTLDRLSRRQALRRLGLIGAAAAVGPGVLAACGSSGGGSSATTAGGTAAPGSTAGGGTSQPARRAAEDRPERQERQGRGLRARQRAGADRQRLVLRQDDEPRHRPGRQAHRGGRRTEHQGRSTRTTSRAIRRPASRRSTSSVPRRCRPSWPPTSTTSAPCSPATQQFKIFTLDGGGGTSSFGQGLPYFWGTRAITPERRHPRAAHVHEGDASRRQDGRADRLGHRRAEQHQGQGGRPREDRRRRLRVQRPVRAVPAEHHRLRRHRSRRSRPTSPTSCWSACTARTRASSSTRPRRPT